jgi:hypothetical protein
MKHHRRAIFIPPLFASLVMALPGTAVAAAPPLLSGYGGPGAGAQAILGGALVNGPGSGGSGSGGLSAASGGSTGATGAAGTLAAGTPRSGSGSTGTAGSASLSPPSTGHPRAGRGAAGSPRAGERNPSRAAGANPNPPAANSATSLASDSAWFSAGDLLALLLVAAALAAVAFATARLARPQP